MYLREVKKKVNLLGNPSVGKTSLILRYVKNLYGDRYLKTVGTNVYTKEVEVVGANIKLIIQDVMGEKSYESVHETALVSSSGAIFVADSTRMETFNDIFDYWIPKFERVAGRSAVRVLAINKMDLEDRAITEEFVIREASRDFDHVFFTSAKTGEGVEEAFNETASRTLFATKKSPLGEDSFPSGTPETPKELLAMLFSYTSRLEEFHYSELEIFLGRCRIDIFALEEDMVEEKVLEFADLLKRWCEDAGYEEGVRDIGELVKRYEGFTGTGAS